MKIDISGDGLVCLKDVYNGVVFVTSECNRLGVCMRDDTLELNVFPAAGKSQWWRIDMATGDIARMGIKELSRQDAECDRGGE